jgi:hypothetical protein
MLNITNKYDRAVRHLGYDPEALTEEEKIRLVEESQRRLSRVKILPDNSLTPTQLSSLSLARAIAGDNVHAAEIPPASDRVRTAGMYSRTPELIFISQEILNSGRGTVDTTIHELAHHTSGAEDGEEAHNAEIPRLASQVVRDVDDRQYDAILAMPDFRWN